MHRAYRFSWILWAIGCALVAGSWVDLVSPQVGWIGFGIALCGTILSAAANRLPTTGSAAEPFLCDTCILNHGEVCWRPERPNATECPDYDRLPAR
jgi:hypothetical protein